ncbi:MAG TPA: SPOR domain-containing protein [Allosphingosinicella sp.]|jgi:hypothetical protein
MTDIRADEPTPLDRDDRLPWLEAVAEEDERDGPSLLKLIVAVLIGLAAIGAIVGGIFWMTNRGGDTLASGEAEVIPAPDGAYKVKPTDPGGMQVEGEGDSAFAASAGGDPKAQLNTNAVPEAPATKAPQQQPAAPAPAAQTPEPMVIPAPAPTPAAGGGGSIQLGAFSSQAGANNAWKAMSGRFKYLGGLTHSVVPVTSGGKTLYRLRASGPGASGICNRLKVAGESCVGL